MARGKYAQEVSPKDKKHFAKILAEDEELILATGFGKHYLRQLFILQIVLPVLLFILIGLAAAVYFFQFNLMIGILIGLSLAVVFSILKTFLTYHSNRYLLTTRRVIGKKSL